MADIPAVAKSLTAWSIPFAQRGARIGLGTCMAWWDSFAQIAFYKKITIFCVAITSVVAAAIAVANALNAGEPYWIATRGLVRQEVAQASNKIDVIQQQLKTRQVQTELQVLQGRVENIKTKINDRELLLQQPDGPPQYKQLVLQQVDEMKDNLRFLQQQTEDLRRELQGRRP